MKGETTPVRSSTANWTCPNEPSGDRRARAFNVAIASPELSAQEVDGPLDASDALKRELDRRGETNTAELLPGVH